MQRLPMIAKTEKEEEEEERKNNDVKGKKIT